MSPPPDNGAEPSFMAEGEVRLGTVEGGGATSLVLPLLALVRLRPFRNAYVGRGLAVWMCARLALAWARIPDPGLATECALLGVVALAVWADARRRSEDLFLGNLGIPSWAIPMLALPMAFLAELLVP